MLYFNCYLKNKRPVPKSKHRPAKLPDGRIVDLSSSWLEEEFVNGNWVPFEDHSLTVGAVWEASLLSDGEIKELELQYRL